MDKIPPFDSLPSFLKNYDAVLDESDEAIEWHTGQKPDYSLVNALYEKEKTVHHPKESLENIVTNLIKNWEKELSHKSNPLQWQTVNPQNFRISVNGSPWKSLEEVGRIGAYNVFLGNTEFYSSDHVKDPRASHQVFRQSLKSGFALEVLEVYTPPPKVTFKFRHWGYMTGDLKCPMRDGKLLEVSAHSGKAEIFGIVVMKVSEDFKIEEMEFFFRGDTLIEHMVHPGR